MTNIAPMESLKAYLPDQCIVAGETVSGFGGNAYVAEVLGPDVASVKVRTFDPVSCYVQRDGQGRLCAVRRVLISDIVYH